MYFYFLESSKVIYFCFDNTVCVSVFLGVCLCTSLRVCVCVDSGEDGDDSSVTTMKR